MRFMGINVKGNHCLQNKVDASSMEETVPDRGENRLKLIQVLMHAHFGSFSEKVCCSFFSWTKFKLFLPEHFYIRFNTNRCSFLLTI